MPKISVVIPTHNRPELLRKAIQSVLSQTYRDFEVIVIDDGLLVRVDQVAASFNDTRIKYIQHEVEQGGSAARNTGIRASTGPFIAFLDDDDEWLPEKLQVQMDAFENTSHDVGFCFSAVKNILDKKSVITKVPEGINDYHLQALYSFKTFLTVTLIIKHYVFEMVGLFDEQFPSHQEAELMIRISKRFKGLGINQPLVRVNMTSHEAIGSSAFRIIEGRKLILKKHAQEFMAVPKALAIHYFQLGLFYRNDNQFQKAQELFKKAWECNHRLLYFLHGLILIGQGKFYRLFRKTTN